MLKRYFLIIGILTGMLFISSCSGTTPYSKDSMVDRKWGISHGTVNYNQMLNPDAAKNPDPVLGLYGPAAAYNMEKYQDSFKETGSQEIVNILKLQ